MRRLGEGVERVEEAMLGGGELNGDGGVDNS